MQQAELESKKIIARSPNMIKALSQATKVASADSTVLILGVITSYSIHYTKLYEF